MSGTKQGSAKARAKILAANPNYYTEIGAKGGKATFETHGSIKGFAANPELARRAGALGGKISKRKPAIKND